MNEKFTPGEWILDEINEDFGYSARIGKRFGEVDGEMRTICIVEAPSEYFRKQWEANAQLIKKAPKMYAMLKSVLEECHACCGDDYPGECSLRSQIENVLKEARGED